MIIDEDSELVKAIKLIHENDKTLWNHPCMRPYVPWFYDMLSCAIIEQDFESIAAVYLNNNKSKLKMQAIIGLSHALVLSTKFFPKCGQIEVSDDPMYEMTDV